MTFAREMPSPGMLGTQTLLVGWLGFRWVRCMVVSYNLVCVAAGLRGINM